MRRVGLAVAVLAFAASAAAANSVTATMTSSSAKPVVDQPWRWTVRVKSGAGKPVAAKVRLQILLGSTVVGCWKRTAMTQCSGANAGTWIAFRGKRTGVISWPAQSVGIKLTFQAVVVARTRTLRLRAPVTVQPAS
ncbi:MAG: hypothetical protein OEW52_03425 [Thermoleophilia bacterium]|nr:hypothetical protein [Thermoleophilia bacterium]MDH5280184.1 hypothetical protein [Thermoleophilia bacterium]